MKKNGMEMKIVGIKRQLKCSFAWVNTWEDVPEELLLFCYYLFTQKRWNVGISMDGNV